MTISEGKGTFSLLLLILTILGSSYPILPSVASTTQDVLYMGLVRLATLPSLNILSPVNAYPIIAEMYVRFAYASYPPSPLLRPELGQSWSSNSNYTVWTLNLRPNLKWDNGRTLNATDLWYTIYLNRYVNTKISPSPPWIYITNITIDNSTAVTVYLNRSTPNFMFSVGTIIVLPYETYSKVPLSNITTFKNFNNIVADGPFVIYNYTEGENPIIFYANPYFFRGKPYMSEMAMNLYSSFSAYEAAIEAGQIDALWTSGGFSSVKAIANLSGYTLYRITPSGYNTITLNVFAYPFNLTKFRQALAYATNRSFIAEKVFGPDYVLMYYDTETPQDHEAGYGPASEPSYTYNLTMTDELLTSLGFTKVNGIWHYPNGSPVSINIDFPSDEVDAQGIATILENMWSQAGFQVTVTAVTEASLYSAMLASKFQVAVYTDFGATTPAPFFDFGKVPGDAYVPTSAPYFNSTYEDLLLKLQTVPFTSNQAKALASQIAQIIADQVPSIPLYETFNWVVARNGYYWGNPQNYTGIFNTELPIQMDYWEGALLVVHPLSSASITASITASTSPSTTVSSSTSYTTTSSTTHVPLYLYVTIAVIVVVVVAATLILLRRR